MLASQLMRQQSELQHLGRMGIMAKGQLRSTKETRKPKAKAPKKTNASKPSKK